MLGSKRSAAVIGAGFFGCVLADHLAKKDYISKVFVIEAENQPITRASINNQARIHRGYHYPRSISTALASSRSYEKFKLQWPSAVFQTQPHIYGVAKNGSHVSGKQFLATMQAVGAPLEKVTDDKVLSEFNLRMLDALFLANEDAFDARELRNWALEVLSGPKISFIKNEKVVSIDESSSISRIKTENGLLLEADLVFNVTYGGIETIEGIQLARQGLIEYEITEMPLIQQLPDFPYSVTVMDGPFFSMMPYPAAGPNIKTLSHVTHTPKRRYQDAQAVNANFGKAALNQVLSNFEIIQRECSLFLPKIATAKHAGSVLEIKAILKKSQTDDSRPILFHRHASNRTFSILGGKIDNVFDMLEYLDREVLK